MKTRIKQNLFLFGVALTALNFPTQAKAFESFYLGAGAGLGQATISAGGLSASGTNMAYGFMMGYRFTPSPFAIGAYYHGITTSSAYTTFGAELDLFPTMTNIFYIGPRVGDQMISSISGVNYGGGAGLNIPIGIMVSIGVDVSYMVGSLSVADTSVNLNTLTILGNLKFWF